MEGIRPVINERPQKFIERFRATVRTRGLSYRTEQTYVHWVVRFIHFHGKRNPSEMGAVEVTAFLTHLAEVQRCAVSTQRIALNALVFLYRHHILEELPQLEFAYARKARRVPTVFTHKEALAVIEELNGLNRLIAGLLYGSGLRITEALTLRLKDIHFGSQQITVRDGKGGNERFTLLPNGLVEDLQQQIVAALNLHRYDLEQGLGEVFMPNALARKYVGAAKQPEWQFLFPSSEIGRDPVTGIRRRHHRHYTSFSRSLKGAIARAGIQRRAGSHTFRHSFATRLIETGYDIKLVQSLLGHRDIRTTEIYLHVVRNRAGAIVGPMDKSR